MNLSFPKLNRKKEDASSVRKQNNLDQKLVHSLNPKKAPNLKQLKYLPKVLSSKEKKLVMGLLLLTIISIVFIGVNFYLQNFLPAQGGEYTEGLVGAPQYINPLLSQTNDVDSDISRLIFSGLLKYDQQLQLINDLAESWETAEDQKSYTFILKEDIKWHDGQPLTADDIIFTVRSIQDPDFKSPLLVSFRGIEIEKIDERTTKFILPDEPYPAFLEIMTFGILPEHIWGEIPPINANLTEYNLKPVGSGPWQFKSLAKDRLGNIKSYAIVANPDYYGPKPYLEKLAFKFYPNFQIAVEALKNHSIEGISFLPKELKKEIINQKSLNFYSFYLPQYTAIFFNQKENEFLKEKSVRQSLVAAIDKSKILSEALQLEGEIIDGPILPGFFGQESTTKKNGFDPEQANITLDEAGWVQITPTDYQTFLKQQAEEALKELEKNKEEDEDNNSGSGDELSADNQATTTQDFEPELELDEEVIQDPQPFYRKKDNQILEITLTTVDQPENIKAVELIQEFWQNIGVKTNLEIIESNRISRETIKPRNYQALLFGIIVGSDPDPYPFWHSSQSQDPGLNLTLFANRNADKLLEDARKTVDEEQRQEKYIQFQNILTTELPAIFLYNPTYTYVNSQKIKGLDIDRVTLPADRFNNLSDWYIKTNRKYKGGDL